MYGRLSYLSDCMKQAGMGVDTWGLEIISSKHYLVGECVKNGKQ